MSNIYLIGYRCTGKSQVGQRLARVLKMAFADLDDEIIRQEKQSITDMVKEKGWGYFRKAEKKALKRCFGREGQVIATGGGIVLDRDNIQIIRSTGKVVWLKASARTIQQRMGTDPATEQNRPPLTEKSRSREIESTLDERVPLYRAAMDVEVDTDDVDIEVVCDRIIHGLDKFGKLV